MQVNGKNTYPYTGELVKHIKTPGLKIEDVFKKLVWEFSQNLAIKFLGSALHSQETSILYLQIKVLRKHQKGFYLRMGKKES